MQNPNFGRSTPKIESLQGRVRKSLELTMAKVAAHVGSPSVYPLPDDPQSAERAIYNLYQALPKKAKDHFFDKAKLILNEGDAKRNEQFGDLMAVDFKSKHSFVEQVKGFKLPEHMRLNESEQNELASILKNNPTHKHFNTKKSASAQPEPEGLAPRTLAFFVDSITCHKTIDILKDEISIEGFVIDALGNKRTINRTEVGKFKKDQTINLGSKGHFADFDLREAGTFPQNFIAGFLLIDKDLVGNDDLVFKFMIASAIICWTAFALFGTFLALSFAFPPLDLAALISVIIAGAFYVITYLIAGLLDDTSGIATDLFVVDFPPAPQIGEPFVRTLNFEISGSVFAKRTANYSASIRWERTE